MVRRLDARPSLQLARSREVFSPGASKITVTVVFAESKGSGSSVDTHRFGG